MISVDQPGCGACVLTPSTKLTSDSNLSSCINTAHEHLGISALLKLNDVRARVIVAMCSNACIDGDSAYQYFNDNLNKVQSDEINIVLDKDSVTSHKLSGLYRWTKMGASKYVAGDDMSLLAKLRRYMPSHCPQTYRGSGSTKFYTLTVPRLFEFLCQICYAIFTPSTGVLLHHVILSYLMNQQTLLSIQ